VINYTIIFTSLKKGLNAQAMKAWLRAFIRVAEGLSLGAPPKAGLRVTVGIPPAAGLSDIFLVRKLPNEDISDLRRSLIISSILLSPSEQHL
jgi:hypothetical protein